MDSALPSTNLFKRIPPFLKPVDFLMDTLQVGRGVAYRIIKGERDLTLKESVILSSKLDVSLDEFVGLVYDDEVKEHQRDENSVLNTREMFFSILSFYDGHLDKCIRSLDAGVIMTSNHLLLLHVIGLDNIFKFFYFRSLHQMQEVGVNYTYSRTIIPAEILTLHKQLALKSFVQGTFTYLLDEFTFHNTLKEIQYYVRRKLISTDELNLIKKDLNVLLNFMQEVILKGYNKRGAAFKYYLSQLNIESNTALVKYDNYMESIFWLNFVHTFRVSANRAVNSVHFNWLNSIRRHSILITQSSEMLQAEFLNRQYELVDKLGKSNSFLYESR